jgi:hypothetical protein
MKNRTISRTLIAMLLTFGLIGGGSAYAFRGDGNCGPQAMGEMQRSPGEFAGKRLEKLHADLKLAPEQEAAWKAWSDPIRQQSAAMGDRMKERESMQKLPAPERMEKMLERMKEHQQKMEGHLGATRAFYNQLSAEQKKVFDAFRPFGGQRGERGGRGGQPRGPAPQQNG